MTVRYFAAARAAAGVAEERAEAPTLGALVSALSGRRAASGSRPCWPRRASWSTAWPGATARRRCPPGATVDVLPPFAGG